MTGRGFGLVIAYLLPGFVLLLGVAELSPDVQAWLKTSAESDSPTVGSFLYVLLASLTAGLIVSAVRWAGLDTLHQATGLARPEWDYANLPGRLEAFELLVDDFYRYYQFYANTIVAVVFTGVARRLNTSGSLGGGVWFDLVLLAVCAVLFAASRNSLGNYYRRMAQLLGTVERKPTMTNGHGKHGDHHGTATSPRTADKKSGTGQDSAEVKDAKKESLTQPDKKK